MLVLSTSVCDRVMSAVPVGLRGALFALSAFGCGSEGAGVQQGHLSLPLSTEAAGTTYRLSGASFDLAGPESRLLESDDDEDLLIAALAAGDYEIELLEGWELQKLDGAEFRAVEAALASDSVQGFTISDGVTTSVTYAFVTDGVLVPLGGGLLEVGISVTVDPPGATVIEGDVLVSSHEELQALAGVQEITGGLTIRGSITDLTALSSLTSIGTFLGIENTELETLDGLEQLVELRDDFKDVWIADNPRLVDIDALSGLTDGENFSLDVRHNPLLEDLDGFRNLSGRGNLWAIFDNASLTTLEGLGGFSSHSAAWIQQNPSLVTLGLTELTFVGGELSIIDNDALLGLEGLENLESVQSLMLDDNDSLVSLSALLSLVEIVSDLFVTSNRSLPSCEADALLGRLIFVPEFVRIEHNAEASCE